MKQVDEQGLRAGGLFRDKVEQGGRGVARNSHEVVGFGRKPGPSFHCGMRQQRRQRYVHASPFRLPVHETTGRIRTRARHPTSCTRVCVGVHERSRDHRRRKRVCAKRHGWSFTLHALDHAFELVDAILELVGQVLVTDSFVDAAALPTGLNACTTVGLGEHGRGRLVKHGDVRVRGQPLVN